MRWPETFESTVVITDTLALTMKASSEITDLVNQSPRCRYRPQGALGVTNFIDRITENATTVYALGKTPDDKYVLILRPSIDGQPSIICWMVDYLSTEGIPPDLPIIPQKIIDFVPVKPEP